MVLVDSTAWENIPCAPPPQTMVAEDDVDAETLQAHVDMTMSFAHNLVTSWIKPSHSARLRPSDTDATQILEEELRRPARLGVGASISMTVPLAHEASKLKRRLGKKDAIDQSVVELRPQGSPGSDDEEHKGRPAKREAKADPFGQESRKKKRKPNSKAVPLSEENDTKLCSVSLNDPILGEPSTHTPPDSLSKNEQERTGPGDQRPVISPSEASRETSAPAPGITSAESAGVHANSMRMPHKSKPFGIPLLNLGGPPESTDRPGNSGEFNDILKKKRKRRKKKKAKMITGTGDSR